MDPKDARPEAESFDRFYAKGTEHSIRTDVPSVVMGDAWRAVETLTLHSDTPGLWVAALAEVSSLGSIAVALAAEHARLPQTETRIDGGATVAFPAGVSSRGSRWLYLDTPAGYHTIALHAKAAYGTVHHVALWATTSDPGDRRPGEMFGCR